jgi:hypothetical protein
VDDQQSSGVDDRRLLHRLGGGCREQGVGERHAVVAVAACGRLPEGAHCGVGDGAVAQNPQRVELALQLDILSARAS